MTDLVLMVLVIPAILALVMAAGLFMAWLEPPPEASPPRLTGHALPPGREIPLAGNPGNREAALWTGIVRRAP